MMLGLLIGLAVAFRPLGLAGVTLDVHTLLAASLTITLGYQILLVGLAARLYALDLELGPPRELLQRVLGVLTLERGVVAGASVFLVGLLFVAYLTVGWVVRGCGPLPIEHTLRPMVIGSTLIGLGAQTVLMSFFFRMFALQKRRSPV